MSAVPTEPPVFRCPSVAIEVGDVEVTGSAPYGWTVKIDGQEIRGCRHLVVELDYEREPLITLTRVIRHKRKTP